jgi:ubiquitin-conjugating enzyme E2 T
MAAQPHVLRLTKEIRMLANDPPPGVVCWPVEGVNDRLEAQIQGPEETPYSEGTFLLEVSVPPRYPFEPPKVRFSTPIYHPNIDDGGRICLDTLKMQPAVSSFLSSFEN